jgi:hypothetical protein
VNRVAGILRVVAVVVSIVLAIGLGVSTVFRSGPHSFGGRTWGSPFHRTDFTVYTSAAQAVLDGTDIYQARNIRGWAYVYPPPFAILMVPFAEMSVFYGSLVWYLVSLSLVVASVAMCVRMVREAQPVEIDGFVLATVPALLLLAWTVPGLARGQANALLLWLVVAAFYWDRKGREALGAVCLAGAVLLKVFPVVLLAYFVWRKRWRFVIGALVALVLLTFVLPAPVFGWHRNLALLHEWIQIVAKPALSTESARADTKLFDQLITVRKLRNQSLEPVLMRLTGSTVARPLAVGTALVMAVVIWVVGRRARPDTELLLVSALVVWMLLALPLAESHYFVLLLLPMTALVSVAAYDEDARIRTVTRTVLAVFAVATLLSTCIQSLEFYGLLCWASLAVWTVSVWVVARRTAQQGL